MFDHFDWNDLLLCFLLLALRSLLHFQSQQTDFWTADGVCFIAILFVKLVAALI